MIKSKLTKLDNSIVDYTSLLLLNGSLPVYTLSCLLFLKLFYRYKVAMLWNKTKEYYQVVIIFVHSLKSMASILT